MSLLSAQRVAIANDVGTWGIPLKVKGRDQRENLCSVPAYTFVVKLINLTPRPRRYQVPYLIQGRLQDRRCPMQFFLVCDDHRRA